MPLIKKFSLLDLIINSSQVHSSIEMVLWTRHFIILSAPYVSSTPKLMEPYVLLLQSTDCMYEDRIEHRHCSLLCIT